MSSPHSTEYENVEVLEEVDATDDENQSEEENQSEDEQPETSPEEGAKISTRTPAGSSSKTPAKAPAAVPGKVKASKEVKDMKLGTPEDAAPSPRPTLTPGKNPFPVVGTWDKKTLSEIEIVFPVLTGKDESTNELTRTNKPESRYWKHAITFRYQHFVSDTIRFDNVHIPCHNGKDYGSSFVYLCLPGFAADVFAENGKTRRPTKVTEKSLVPDKNRWWKVANKVDSVFGVINGDTKRFQTKSLSTIFDGTQAGISATVVLKFICKASTEESSPLKPTTPCTIAVEVVRGYINGVDIDVQMPVRLNKQKPKIEPAATSKDIATDSLMKRLGELGL